jgi:hypothetical protein
MVILEEVRIDRIQNTFRRQEKTCFRVWYGRKDINQIDLGFWVQKVSEW